MSPSAHDMYTFPLLSDPRLDAMRSFEKDVWVTTSCMKADWPYIVCYLIRSWKTVTASQHEPTHPKTFHHHCTPNHSPKMQTRAIATALAHASIIAFFRSSHNP